MAEEEAVADDAELDTDSYRGSVVDVGDVAIQAAHLRDMLTRMRSIVGNLGRLTF